MSEESERRRFILSSRYSSGYRDALHDVLDWFEAHSNSLANFRMYNRKSIRALLLAMAKNYEAFEENGRNTKFIIKHNGKSTTVVLEGDDD